MFRPTQKIITAILSVLAMSGPYSTFMEIVTTNYNCDKNFGFSHLSKEALPTSSINSKSHLLLISVLNHITRDFFPQCIANAIE